MSLRRSSHYNLSRKQRGGDPGFPTTPLNAYQSVPLDDNGGAVLEKLDPTGRLKYSTFLSGNSFHFGLRVTVGAIGNACVAGGAVSPNFTVTAGAFRTTT